MPCYYESDWKEILFPNNMNSEIGQRLGISYVRTLQEKVDVQVLDSALHIDQSSLGMMAISSVIWDCGLLLVDFLCSCKEQSNNLVTINFDNSCVLELGCGTGLVGLSTLLLGCNKLVMSDIVLTESVERSLETESKAHYIHYDWNDPNIPTTFTDSRWDFIICSDVLYESKNHAGLLRLLSNLNFTTLIIAYKRRHEIEEQQFFETLSYSCDIKVVDSDSITLRNISKTALSGLFIVVVKPKAV